MSYLDLCWTFLGPFLQRCITLGTGPSPTRKVTQEQKSPHHCKLCSHCTKTDFWVKILYFHVEDFRKQLGMLSYSAIHILGKLLGRPNYLYGVWTIHLMIFNCLLLAFEIGSTRDNLHFWMLPSLWISGKRLELLCRIKG